MFIQIATYISILCFSDYILLRSIYCQTQSLCEMLRFHFLCLGKLSQKLENIREAKERSITLFVVIVFFVWFFKGFTMSQPYPMERIKYIYIREYNFRYRSCSGSLEVLAYACKIYVRCDIGIVNIDCRNGQVQQMPKPHCSVAQGLHGGHKIECRNLEIILCILIFLAISYLMIHYI